MPTPDDRLCFLLTSLKTDALQVAQGHLEGIGKAKPIHECISSSPRCWRRCTPWALPRPAPSRPERRDSTSRRPTRPRWSHRERSSQPPWRPSQRPPCAHDGTARRIVRPQAPPAQIACESGKTKDHTVKNVLLLHALRTIHCLSATDGGRIHDTPLAAAPPAPFPAGSGCCGLWAC